MVAIQHDFAIGSVTENLGVQVEAPRATTRICFGCGQFHVFRCSNPRPLRSVPCGTCRERGLASATGRSEVVSGTVRTAGPGIGSSATPAKARVIVGKKGENSWITWIGSDAQPLLADAAPEYSDQEFQWHQGTLSEQQWETRVAQAIAKIDKSEIDKVVLARDLIATTDKAIDVRPVLNKLAANYPATWVFSVDGLIGATPELLLRLSRGMVTSRVLAGTIPKTGDDARDLALSGSLARSSKDLEEHEYAVRSVAEALEPFSSSTNVPEAPFVLHLANVMHLATDVTGALLESKHHVDAFALLKSLHPSAAVCGTPRNIAFDVIDEIEGMNRGRYAGPVGWIDARGDGELGIALRSGQVTGNEIRIFAGCGIVAGSDPVVELAESNAKFSAMKSAL